MAKLSLLNAVTTPGDADLLYLVQGGVSKKITFANLVAQVGGGVDAENYFATNVKVLPAPSGGSDTAMVQGFVDNYNHIILRPNSTYLVSDIKPHNNLKISAADWSSVLKQNANQAPIHWAHGEATLLENVTLEGFQIDGDKTAGGWTEGCGILLNRALNVHVDRMYVHDTPKGCIVLGNPNNGEGGGFWVTRCKADNAGVNPPPPGQFWGSIGFTGGDDIFCMFNLCVASPGTSAYGIDFETNPGWVLRRGMAAYNICRNGGIFALAGTGSMSDIWIDHNYADAANTTGGGTAIQAEGITGECSIQDNYVIGPAALWTGISAACNNAKIARNTVTGMGVDQNTEPFNVGIYCSWPGAKIIDNHIFAAVATHATAIAGIVDSGLGDQEVRGNTFENIPVTGVFQSGDVVATANLPAAGLVRPGTRLIEDAGAGVFNYIDYVSLTVRHRTSMGSAF